jgi:hypothetical protein
MKLDELKVVMQFSIVSTYSSLVTFSDGMALGVVRNSRYTTPSAWKPSSTEVVEYVNDGRSLQRL